MTPDCRSLQSEPGLPDARFQGISRSLLQALERRAAQRGNTKVMLESTETARRFYLSSGYTEIGRSIEAFGTASYQIDQESLRWS